jgi:hypothetical protein
MQWVDRIQEATGWREARWECDWGPTEVALGVSLPIDYKELCERFGPGYFSSYIWVMPDRGRDSLISWWRANKARYEKNSARMARRFSPYEPYGASGQYGLIWWGTSESEGNFCWLADAAANPDTWPIVAKGEMIAAENWHQYEMPVSEFVYRVIADPEFKPYTVASPDWPPTFSRFEDFSSDV